MRKVCIISTIILSVFFCFIVVGCTDSKTSNAISAIEKKAASDYRYGIKVKDMDLKSGKTQSNGTSDMIRAKFTTEITNKYGTVETYYGDEADVYFEVNKDNVVNVDIKFNHRTKDNSNLFDRDELLRGL